MFESRRFRLGMHVESRFSPEAWSHGVLTRPRMPNVLRPVSCDSSEIQSFPTPCSQRALARFSLRTPRTLEDVPSSRSLQPVDRISSRDDLQKYLQIGLLPP
jgi:hypothetical protein